MTILVTGGSGVVGKYVIDELSREYDVLVADIEPTEHHKYIKIDLIDPFKLPDDIDVCIHLAALVGGISYFINHPVENIRNNTRMTLNLLDAAVNAKVNHVIYTSSSVVYQHDTNFPSVESSVPTLPPPDSAYGMSKLFGEYMCRAYHEQFGLKYTILRPFNIYGPKEFPDPEYAHVIPDFVRKTLASTNGEVEIYGDGNQIRTFTHGRDAARAYLLALEDKAAINEDFNVSGNEEIRIGDLLNMVWKILDRHDLKVKNLPALPHDVNQRIPSNKKIRERLGWEPLIPFKDGLSETVSWLS